MAVCGFVSSFTCLFCPLQNLSKMKPNSPSFNPALKDRKTASCACDNGLEVSSRLRSRLRPIVAALAVEAAHGWTTRISGWPTFWNTCSSWAQAPTQKNLSTCSSIHDNGGTVNAYTATDRTVYIFSINNEAFDGALDRFSHFFIDPLFSPSCIGRELHAVDQEHAKNIEHDGWRQYMVFKETGNPAHPNNAFSTGNAKTLSGIPQTALKDWYQKNYSADRITWS